MFCSDSDSDSEPAPGKKEYIFTTKKDAVDAFKNLLRDKVSGTIAVVCSWCDLQLGIICMHFA